jgi:glycerophosphoryl diester phosphodiesterase
MRSFQEACDAGCDYFELDVHLTRDDVPVVFHDDDIGPRVCSDAIGRPVSGLFPIRQLLASDLQKYDIGQVPQPKFPDQDLEKGARIPTLEEVLLWTRTTSPDLRVNIELKVEKNTSAPDPEIYATQILKVLKSTGMESRVLLQSFDFRPLEALRRRAPALDYSYLFENETDFAARAVALKAPAVGPYFQLVTRESVEFCHARGIAVVPWTVNEPADWDRLLEWNIDGIITDYPRALAAHLTTAN